MCLSSKKNRLRVLELKICEIGLIPRKVILMREVNNNTSNPSNINFQGIPAKKDAVPQSEAIPVESSEVTDLGKMPAEVIGRSQVPKTAAEKDLGTLFKNPEVVRKSLEFFELCEAYGKTPVEAAELMGAYAEEFYV